ncbi:prepilin-type N-terminal cleavage/methylation domain-containing protein [Deinococcus metalli]|uniref:Prepilin-type N-terminal cleavage/methylation domain-containing protein n=1 Tax=Deinococcus metalli TaxID=1141878 RepID=A0A7W8NQP7_9DEIO|nr:type II secretion system protein [Deinococcus metalli]MBB5376083.1 prepilin-type N-terminal cleavage/methylation domain-containing protein [Deinococcus metalli]
MPDPRTPLNSVTAGFTLVELLIVLAVLGILFALGISSYRSTLNPARDAARTVHAAFFTLRSQAMSNTQARRLVLVGSKNLVLQSALRCSETTQTNWTQIGTVDLGTSSLPLTLTAPTPATTDPTVPTGTKLVACFTSRGQASTAGSLRISDTKHAYLVQVALGGGVYTSAQ